MAPDCLKPGGRIGIMSFHCGENRQVKHAFADGCRDGLYTAASEILTPSQTKIAPTPKAPPLRNCV